MKKFALAIIVIIGIVIIATVTYAIVDMKKTKKHLNEQIEVIIVKGYRDPITREVFGLDTTRSTMPRREALMINNYQLKDSLTEKGRELKLKQDIDKRLKYADSFVREDYSMFANSRVSVTGANKDNMKIVDVCICPAYIINMEKTKLLKDLKRLGYKKVTFDNIRSSRRFRIIKTYDLSE